MVNGSELQSYNKAFLTNIIKEAPRLRSISECVKITKIQKLIVLHNFSAKITYNIGIVRNWNSRPRKRLLYRPIL